MKRKAGTMLRKLLLAGAVELSLTASVGAQDLSKFKDGPVITGFGKVVPIESDLPIPKRAVFKVILDVSAAAKPGEANRAIDSAARFLNMHVAAGVPEKNIHIVIVVHGTASGDVANDAFYAPRHDGKANASAPLIKQLLDHGVQIYLCGQSGTAFGLSHRDLLPGVKLSLSAMTTVALFEQQGYVLLP
mgnify:CR=1 FL=1